MTEQIDLQSPAGKATPEMDRMNGRIFFMGYMLVYFVAPVLYVDVVQAALCNKLGANATIANLPLAAYSFGCFAPFLLSRIIPYRQERAAVVTPYAISAALSATVCVVLILPVGNSIRIAAVITQGLIQGLCSSTASVYMYQCLGRGTTPEGRARALKLTFTITPICAVVGSLGAQYILSRNFPFQNYLYDFAFLYFIAVPATAAVAFAWHRFKLLPLVEEVRPPLFRYLSETVKSFVSERPLVLLWVAFLLWTSTIYVLPNLALYSKHVLGKSPKDYAGLMMALRFGFKCLGGYLLGWLTLRWGERVPLITSTLLIGGAILWAWMVPGYFYLLAFGLMGAGELGGAYFPNYVISYSRPEEGARNQSMLALVTAVASVSPAVHGVLTDTFGFSGSFTFGIVTAILGLLLVSRLPRKPSQQKS